jgi:cell division protein FtsQ
LANSSSRLADPEDAGAARRRWPAVRLVLVLMVSACAIAVATSRTPLFRLRHLEVVGNLRLSRTDVLRLAGISRSSNVLWLDTEAVTRRLEQDPWIAKAVVSRRAPWTVRISVVERRPVAEVNADGGYTLVSGDGVALGIVRADPELPIIALAQPVPGSAPTFEWAARAIAALRGCPGCRVARADVGQDGTVRITLSGGIQVRYGLPTDMGAKTAAVRRILLWTRHSGRTIAGIDVSAEGAPAATFG